MTDTITESGTDVFQNILFLSDHCMCSLAIKNESGLFLSQRYSILFPLLTKKKKKKKNPLKRNMSYIDFKILDNF